MLNYTLPTESDLLELTEWVSKDPYHKVNLTAQHFMPKPDKNGEFEKGIVYVKVSDENGTAFYLRLSNVMRAEIQFPAAVEPESLRKNLKEAFSYVYVKAKEMGYHEILFDSVSQHLISFFSRLGFSPVKDHYKVPLL